MFACLALKAFFQTDYRGLAALLTDLAELRAAVGLRRAPHFTTLHKAGRRLLRQPKARRLFRATVRRFLGRRRRVRRAALDSTGLDCGRRSACYVRRRHGGASQTVTYSRFAKLEAGLDCQQPPAGQRAGRPRAAARRRSPGPAARGGAARVRVGAVLADAGYDSEANHHYARQACAAPAFIPAAIGRPSTKPPSGYPRRQMKRGLNKRYGQYGQRWQVEAGFSMLKRRLGSTVAGHSYYSPCRDLWLLAITYNLMLVAGS